MAREKHCGRSLSCRKESGRKVCRSRARLTTRQVAGVVIGAGFLAERTVQPAGQKKRYSPAGMMTAIVLAEHRGVVDPYVIGWNPDGSMDVGTFSINDVHNLGCKRMDPVASGRFAYQLSGAGATFSPWSAYNDDLHLKYLDRAERAVQSDPKAIKDFDDIANAIGDSGLPGAGAYSGALNAGDKVLDASDAVFSWLSGGWATDAVKILLTGALAGTGLALAGYGLVQATKSTGRTKEVVQVATTQTGASIPAAL